MSARATTRAAERAMVMLAAEVPVNPAALAYINRLFGPAVRARPRGQ